MLPLCFHFAQCECQLLPVLSTHIATLLKYLSAFNFLKAERYFCLIKKQKQKVRWQAMECMDTIGGGDNVAGFKASCLKCFISTFICKTPEMLKFHQRNRTCGLNGLKSVSNLAYKVCVRAFVFTFIVYVPLGLN